MSGAQTENAVNSAGVSDPIPRPDPEPSRLRAVGRASTNRLAVHLKREGAVPFPENGEFMGSRIAGSVFARIS